MDREKVITGLELCTNISPDGCLMLCPYKDEKDETYSGFCEHVLKRDALALLKEQEIGHWVALENCSNAGVYCSECRTKVFDHYPIKKKLSYFCPHCGTRMEGEIERR